MQAHPVTDDARGLLRGLVPGKVRDGGFHNKFMQQLSEDVCGPVTLSRIGNSERPPSIRAAKTLLGKAGIKTERLQKEITSI